MQNNTQNYIVTFPNGDQLQCQAKDWKPGSVVRMAIEELETKQIFESITLNSGIKIQKTTKKDWG